MEALQFIKTVGLNKVLKLQSLVRKDDYLSRVADNDGLYIDLEHERVVIQKPIYHNFYISYNELEDELVSNFQPLLNSNLGYLKRYREFLKQLLTRVESEEVSSEIFEHLLRVDLSIKYQTTIRMRVLFV